MAGYARGHSAVVVGTLAVAATTAFSALFLYMTNRGLSWRHWEVHVRMATAEGLGKRDPVLFRGVNIGEVRSLAFAETGEVVVKTRLNQRVPLSRGVHAELVPIDLFGKQSLVFREARGRGVPLQDGDTIAGEAPSSMTGAVVSLGERAGRVLNDSTVDLLRRALDGTSAAGQGLAALSARLDTLLRTQQYALRSLVAHADGAARNLEIATDPSALGAMRDEVARAASGIAGLTARLDTTAASAAELLGALHARDGTTGRLMTDPALYDRTAELLSSMDALVRDIRTNPKRYINVSVF